LYVWPMAKILLIEDDTVLRETLAYNLECAGYETLTASDGLEGLDLARGRSPDLIILDVMLPGLDGLSVCRMVRAQSALPIIILSARTGEVDRIAGFEVGADDYVVKPFSLGEMLARIRVSLRRSVPGTTEPVDETLVEGDLRMETRRRRAYRRNQELCLSQKEYDLLACLMRHAGTVLSRELLLERVWGETFVRDTRTIDVHIRWLRMKVEDEPSRPVYIQTVRGMGYRLAAPRRDGEETGLAYPHALTCSR
jgi:DNA-binding response OmpR family regulator